jgi:uncharacterized protein YjiS (DUF1127 family)
MKTPSRIAATIFAWGARAALWPVRVTAARAAFRQLAAMDARELADIGLAAQDLRDATALALDEDPTRALAARAGRGADSRAGTPAGGSTGSEAAA